MNIIFALSKTYIDYDILCSEIINTANNLKLDFDSTEYYINLYVPNFGDMFEIVFEDDKSFSAKMKDNDFIENYGPLFSIWYNNNGKEEDTTVVPFLREFLGIFPEVIVFNDEVLGKPPYVFKKPHFDNYEGTDYYELLFNEPENLETSS